MAVFLGSLIGYERRSSDRPAGIRTMALVSLGSALFTINSTFAFLDGPMVSEVVTINFLMYRIWQLNLEYVGGVEPILEI